MFFFCANYTLEFLKAKQFASTKALQLSKYLQSKIYFVYQQYC